ncbi:DUF4253 domain-containing protein [Nocardiopsis sp. RSe5-2]|uniref:DUF4253 domain-containing protein n=1 Tax=Nocardiopsis endophytica TaxID=3018445 RepID=A0ABT4U6U9_9ACTN|nr:DUF4253 domain-containing protein [Nocardiopsis endophytica]MDA2812668.1 DUF4253 domain-containing protein [Nocardiopsis endophytica]
MHLPMPIPVLRTACAQRGCSLPQMDRVAMDVAGSPVYVARVPEKDVLALWSSLRALHDSSGWWPVLSGDPSPTLIPWEMLDGSVDPSALALGNKHNAVSLLQDLYVRTFHDLGPGDAPVPSLVHDAADLSQRLTLRAEAADPPGSDRDVLFEPEPSTPWAVASPTTLLMLVRASAGYEVPALLRWDGACNHGIEGHEHMAVLRHFHEEYGAELVGMTGDVIELAVDRAPATAGGAALAAMEMYAYCPDIVLQGIGTVEALAERVAPTGDWFLWWD